MVQMAEVLISKGADVNAVAEVRLSSFASSKAPPVYDANMCFCALLLPS